MAAAEIIHPKSILAEVSRTPRSIEQCQWFHPVRIDFDLINGLPQDPEQQLLLNGLSESIARQGHPAPGVPNDSSDMIVGFFDIPPGDSSLKDRIPEIPMLGMRAKQDYGIKNITDRNYTVVITTNEDVAKMKKRETEELARTVMSRLGALKVLIINPNYYGLATMEGGFAVEPRNNPKVFDNLRDRLVTHACAHEAGKYTGVPDIIDENQWKDSKTPSYLVDVFRTLGEYGYIDPPFDISQVASEARARQIQFIMGWSRQSESAGAVFDHTLTVPQEYRMGDATGAIIATGTGRFNNINKLNMDRNAHLTVVSIVPRHGDTVDRVTTLESFDRYALGRRGSNIVAPSIEFDEMAKVFQVSPLVRLSPHPDGEGYIVDPNGSIAIPRVRAFVHVHQAIESISDGPVMYLKSDGQIIFPKKRKNFLDVVEYVPANFKDFPYPVGCGKDIMFACSADAAQRSRGVNDINSDIGLVLFDATNHGTNFLILTGPLPGTDVIPENPFALFLSLIHPESGAIRLSNELQQV